MAGVVDVLLRLVGDSRDAVRAVDDVGQAADRTTAKVSRTSETLQIMAARVGGVATAVFGIVEGFQEAARRADDLLNREPQADVGQAISAAETARALESAGGTRLGDVFNPRNLTRRGVLFGGSNQDADRRVRDAIAALASSNPAQLQAALPFLSDDAADQARRALERRAQATAFQASLTPPSTAPTVVVNTGVGDPNRIGDEVHRALERAGRNNNRRYITTVSG